MMVYILIRKSDKKPIGIFSTGEIARNNAIEGEYLIIPVELDRRYDGGIINEGMAGAIIIKAAGTELSYVVSQTLTKLINIEMQLKDFKTRLSTLESTKERKQNDMPQM